VARCVERGLIVHQGDILDGLDQYGDDSFDFILLLGTFQELLSPETVLRESFRVSRQVIVGYMNFAYWRSRLQLVFSGRSPRQTSNGAP
jgi:methionine biosynthesis protein MetW